MATIDEIRRAGEGLDVRMIALVEGIGYYESSAGSTVRAWFVDGTWQGTAPTQSIIIPTLKLDASITETVDLIGGVSPPSSLEFEVGEYVDPPGDPGGVYTMARMMGNLAPIIVGPNTAITSTLTRAATTINVESTTGFHAGPAHLWIGTECIKYTSTSGGNQFTGCTRGEFHPVIDGSAFPHYHEFRDDENAVSPMVTQWPYTWIGRKVVIYALHVQTDGTFAGTSDAYRVWTGRVVAKQWNGKVWKIACRSIMMDLERMLFNLPKPTEEVLTTGFILPGRTGPDLPSRNISHKTSSGATYTIVTIGNSVTGTNTWFADAVDFIQGWSASVPTDGVYLHDNANYEWIFTAGGGTGERAGLGIAIANCVGQPSVEVNEEDFVLSPSPNGRFQFRFDADSQVPIRVTSVPDSMATSSQWQYWSAGVNVLWLLFIDANDEGRWIVVPMSAVTTTFTAPNKPRFTVDTARLPLAAELISPRGSSSTMFVTESDHAIVRRAFVPNWQSTTNTFSDPILQMMISYTGTTGGYDVHPAHHGIAMSVDDIDTASFVAIDSLFPTEILQRQIVISKPTQMKELLDTEGRTLGIGFVMRDGLVTAVRLPTFEDKTQTAVLTLDRTSMSNSNERALVAESADTLFNTIVIKFAYDNVDENFVGEVQLVDVQSIGAFGRTKVLEIANKGILTSRDILPLLLSRLGVYRFPWPSVQRSFNRTIVGRMNPGDVVQMQDQLIPDIINRTWGTAGEGSRVVVESVTTSLPDFVSNKITLRQLPGGVLYPYAPSGLISSINAPTNTIVTLTASPTFGASEITYFAVNDVVFIGERAALNITTPATGPWRRTITSINVAARTITLSSALTGFDTNSEYFITFDVYTSVVEAQQILGSWLADGGVISGTTVYRIYG